MKLLGERRYVNLEGEKLQAKDAKVRWDHTYYIDAFLTRAKPGTFLRSIIPPDTGQINLMLKTDLHNSHQPLRDRYFQWEFDILHRTYKLGTFNYLSAYFVFEPNNQRVEPPEGPGDSTAMPSGLRHQFSTLWATCTAVAGNATVYCSDANKLIVDPKKETCTNIL